MTYSYDNVAVFPGTQWPPPGRGVPLKDAAPAIRRVYLEDAATAARFLRLCRRRTARPVRLRLVELSVGLWAGRAGLRRPQVGAVRKALRDLGISVDSPGLVDLDHAHVVSMSESFGLLRRVK